MKLLTNIKKKLSVIKSKIEYAQEWWRLRPFRKYIKGIDMEKYDADMAALGEFASFDMTGNQEAIQMLKMCIKQHNSISLHAVIEAQCEETKRHCPRSRTGMDMVIELSRVLKQ